INSYFNSDEIIQTSLSQGQCFYSAILCVGTVFYGIQYPADGGLKVLNSVKPKTKNTVSQTHGIPKN
ncbi:MAG: hypothetical protein Q7J86_14320, partial [Bacteroidota bacterium]|nr:hypothetical protein [Bacteroidota bacterium]